MILEILQYTVAVATILTGLVSIFWPLKVLAFTGLQVSGGRGVSEIRAVLGALFVGLGASALYFNAPETYAMLGIAYLTVAAVRGISMFVDRAVVSSNTISLVVEVIFGAILVL
jgi:hypothetical protein